MRVKGVKNKLAVFVSAIVLAAEFFTSAMLLFLRKKKVRKNMIRPTVGGLKMENR